MPFSKLQKTLLPLLAALLLFPAAVPAAEHASSGASDSSKKRIEREKTFLMRASDDMGRTAASANEAVLLLRDQYEAVAGKEPDSWIRERATLLDWYQKYADWLNRMSAEFDTETADFFEGHSSGSWTARYDEIAKGYQKQSGQLSTSMRAQEEEKKRNQARMQKLNTAVMEGRILVDKDDLELAKELWPNYRTKPYDSREVVYKDLTDEELDRFRYELKQLGDRQKFLGVLLELEQYELNWMNARSEEASQLYALAGVIGSNATAAIVSASRSTARLYESDAAAFTRKAGGLESRLDGITRTGTMKTLDLLDEQTRYCEKMKLRYEKHVEWLKGQIGEYQADLVELSRDM